MFPPVGWWTARSPGRERTCRDVFPHDRAHACYLCCTERKTASDRWPLSLGRFENLRPARGSGYTAMPHRPRWGRGWEPAGRRRRRRLQAANDAKREDLKRAESMFYSALKLCFTRTEQESGTRCTLRCMDWDYAASTITVSAAAEELKRQVGWVLWLCRGLLDSQLSADQVLGLTDRSGHYAGTIAPARGSAWCMNCSTVMPAFTPVPPLLFCVSAYTVCYMNSVHK